MTGTARRREQKPSLAQLEKTLKDPAVLASWTPEQIRDVQKRISRLRGRYYGRDAFVMLDDDEPQGPTGGCVGGICCSHAWADACWEDKAIYPPPANRTPMVQCAVCRADVPAIAMEGGCCADCRKPAAHYLWGPSISGLAFTAVRERKLRLDEPLLLAEDDASLRREIKLAEAGRIALEVYDPRT